MSLTLINRSGRCLALNLPHAEVCTAVRCSCVTLPGRPPRRVAGSITLPAGQALTDLQYGRAPDPYGWTMKIEVGK